MTWRVLDWPPNPIPLSRVQTRQDNDDASAARACCGLLLLLQSWGILSLDVFFSVGFCTSQLDDIEIWRCFNFDRCFYVFFFEKQGKGGKQELDLVLGHFIEVVARWQSSCLGHEQSPNQGAVCAKMTGFLTEWGTWTNSWVMQKLLVRIRRFYTFLLWFRMFLICFYPFKHWKWSNSTNICWIYPPTNNSHHQDDMKKTFGSRNPQPKPSFATKQHDLRVLPKLVSQTAPPRA